MLADSIFLSNVSAEQSVAEEIRSRWRLARGACFRLCLRVPFSVTPDESSRIILFRSNYSKNPD